MPPVQDRDTEAPSRHRDDQQHDLDPLAATPGNSDGAAPSDPTSNIRFEGPDANMTASSGGSSSSQDMRRRTTFVSRHRKALNHISSDALEARRHPVPAHRQPSSDAILEDTSSCCAKWTASCRETMAAKSPDDWLGTILPMYSWLKGYPWRTAAVQDLVAGLTVGVMIVPQSMSYAKLAGLPVEYGLYSGVLCDRYRGYFGVAVL